MSTARSYPRLSLCLVFTALLISASPGQGQATISIMIDPPEATVHIGETQSFMALVNGTVNAGIQWTVQEANGGSISNEGVYTAPKDADWPKGAAFIVGHALLTFLFFVLAASYLGLFIWQVWLRTSGGSA